MAKSVSPLAENNFPMRVDNILKWFYCPWKQIGSHKCGVSLQKQVEKWTLKHHAI